MKYSIVEGIDKKGKTNYSIQDENGVTYYATKKLKTAKNILIKILTRELNTNKILLTKDANSFSYSTKNSLINRILHRKPIKYID